MESPPARKSNGKSRFGCVACKTRRIKCDEQHPVCSQCSKRNQQCYYKLPRACAVGTINLALHYQPPVWNAHYVNAEENKSKLAPEPPPAPRGQDGQARPSTAWATVGAELQSSRPTIPTSPTLLEPSTLNLTQMRLLVNFKENTARTLLPSGDIWARDVVRIALKHEFVMHALLMISGRHMRILDRSNSSVYHFAELQHRQSTLSSLRTVLARAKSSLLTDVDIRDGIMASALLLAYHSCSDPCRVPLDPWPPGRDNETSYESLATEASGKVDLQTDGFLPLVGGVRAVAHLIWTYREESLFAELLAKPLLLISSSDVAEENGTLPKFAEIPKPLEVSASLPTSEYPGSPEGFSGSHFTREMSSSVSNVLSEPVDNFNVGNFSPLLDSTSSSYDLIFNITSSLSSLTSLLSSPLPQSPLLSSDEDLMLTTSTYSIYRAALAHLRPLLALLGTDTHHEDLIYLFLSWASFCPVEFHNLAQANHPGALIILAHYYAAGAILCMRDGIMERRLWWWSDRPRITCRSICSALGEEWMDWVRFPRLVAGLS